MRHIWLLLLIACGSIHFPGVLTLPEAHPAKSSAAAGGGNGGGAGGGAGGGVGGASAQTSGEPGSELGDYDDEEPQKAPGNLAKSTPTPKLPAPFFNQKAVDVYVPENATRVKLECPVKNYDPDRHVILWYKDNNQLSNGETLMNNIYTLDSQFSLTVPLSSNATELRFSCSVMPQNVRRQVTIRFGPEPSTPAPAVDPSPDATPPPAHDSATDFRRDIGLWPAAALLLAAIQVAGQALY